jgi:hypothetical protein
MLISLSGLDFIHDRIVWRTGRRSTALRHAGPGRNPSGRYSNNRIAISPKKIQLQLVNVTDINLSKKVAAAAFVLSTMKNNKYHMVMLYIQHDL